MDDRGNEIKKLLIGVLLLTQWVQEVTDILDNQELSASCNKNELSPQLLFDKLAIFINDMLYRINNII